MRDSVAPRSYVDSRSQAFSDSRAWLCKSKPREENACDICSLQAVSVLGHVDFQIDPPSRALDSAWPGRSCSATNEARIQAHARAGAMI